MDGFLNLHKPAGLTSHDCVVQVRRSLKMKRVGHGG
ncbi:MAG: tRNA pseudouridine(55) synthase TruB, partial [Cyanobacteriota bacterium]